LCDDDSTCTKCRQTLTFPTNTCVVVDDDWIYQHQTFSCIPKIPQTMKGALRLAAWESNQCLVNNWDTAWLFDIELGCIANYAYEQGSDGFLPPTSINLTCNNFAFFFDFCWDSPQRMCPSQNCTIDISLKLGCWDLWDDGAFWINCNANVNADQMVEEFEAPVPAQGGFNPSVLDMVQSNNPVIKAVKKLLERTKARAASKRSLIAQAEEEAFTPIN